MIYPGYQQHKAFIASDPQVSAGIAPAHCWKRSGFPADLDAVRIRQRRHQIFPRTLAQKGRKLPVVKSAPALQFRLPCSASGHALFVTDLSWFKKMTRCFGAEWKGFLQAAGHSIVPGTASQAHYFLSETPWFRFHTDTTGMVKKNIF